MKRVTVFLALLLFASFASSVLAGPDASTTDLYNALLGRTVLSPTFPKEESEAADALLARPDITPEQKASVLERYAAFFAISRDWPGASAKQQLSVDATPDDKGESTIKAARRYSLLRFKAMAGDKEAEKQLIALLDDATIALPYSLHLAYIQVEAFYAGSNRPTEAKAVVDKALANNKITGSIRGLWESNKITTLLDQKKNTEAVAFLNSLTTANDYEHRMMLGNIQTKIGDNAQAIAAYLTAGRMVASKKEFDLRQSMGAPAFSQAVRLTALTDKVKAQEYFIEYLNDKMTPGISADESSMIDVLLPDNDNSKCFYLTAQQVMDKLKFYMRKETGRITPETLAAFAKQLNTGDGSKALVITDEAKALASAIDSNCTNEHIKVFMIPFLTGDYATAAKVAFAGAKQETIDKYYADWIKDLSGVVRCNDQCYNKRALDVIRWVNSDIQENPVADLLTGVAATPSKVKKPK